MSDDFDFEPEPEEAAPPPRTTRARRGPSRTTKRATALADSLTKQMVQTGAVIGMAMPVTGYYVAEQADPFCSALVRLAGRDARYIEALEQLASVGPGITIGRTVVGIGCAMGVDRWHRSEGLSGINPDKRAAMLLGVASAYYEVYGDEEAVHGGSAAYAPPPPGRFVPVA